MTYQQEESNHVIQIMCIMDRLQRLALSSHDEAFPPGMTISQLSCIGYLAFKGEEDVYQRDLENHFKLRRSTVSSLLSNMEEKGLLLRISVPQDGRLRKLVLTTTGRSLGEQVQHFFFRLNDLMVQNLSEEEQNALQGILVKIDATLNELDA